MTYHLEAYSVYIGKNQNKKNFDVEVKEVTLF